MIKIKTKKGGLIMDKKLALEIIQSLKREEHVLKLMKENNYDKAVCWAGIPFLKLEEKSEEELISIMKKTDYNRYICWIGISFLKSADRILEVMRKSDNNQLIYDAGIPLLKLEKVRK